MEKIVISLCLMAAFLYPQQQFDISWPTLAKSEWPMIKHDPQFTGRSPYKGPQTPTIIWTADLEYGIFSGPVIGDKGNLFFGTYASDIDSPASDYFYCYKNDGTFLWKYKTYSNHPPASGILIDSNNVIYFGGAMDKNLYALNSDGELLWKYQTSAIIGYPILNIDLMGNIYLTNADSLYSIKPDGSLYWKVKYENGFGAKSPVFAPDGNTMYLPGADSNLFAINIDGSMKWKFRCGEIKKAAAVDNDGNIYITPNEYPQYFYSLLPDKTIRWKYLVQQKWAAGSNSVPAIDYNGNTYIIVHDTNFVGNYPMALLSIDYNGKFRWKYTFNDLGPDDPEDFWQPLICDSAGTVYVGSTFGWYYYAIDTDGELKWRLPLEFNQKQVDNTAAISKNGTLYIGVHGVATYPGGLTKTLIAIKDTGAVSVNENNFEIKDYSLSQNYPNPFNPKTRIKYSIPQKTNVTFKVYNMLGREISVLFDEEKPAGEYELTWDASAFPSGIYFLKMQTDHFSATAKLLLIK